MRRKPSINEKVAHATINTAQIMLKDTFREHVKELKETGVMNEFTGEMPGEHDLLYYQGFKAGIATAQKVLHQLNVDTAQMSNSLPYLQDNYRQNKGPVFSFPIIKSLQYEWDTREFFTEIYKLLQEQRLYITSGEFLSKGATSLSKFWEVDLSTVILRAISIDRKYKRIIARIVPTKFDPSGDDFESNSLVSDLTIGLKNNILGLYPRLIGKISADHKATDIHLVCFDMLSSDDPNIFQIWHGDDDK